MTIKAKFSKISKQDTSVRETDVINKVEYLENHKPFQSSLLIVTEDPEELGDNEENATKANVDVVIKPSAVIKMALFSPLAIFSKKSLDSF